MKKLIAIIIATMMLTGCFDYVQPRETHITVTEAHTEHVQATESDSETETDKIVETETETETETYTETERITQTVYVWSREGANIREQADINSERLDVALFGERITAFRDTFDEEWVEIVYHNSTAYIYSTLLTTSYDEIVRIRQEIADEARRAAESELREKLEQQSTEADETPEIEPQEATEATETEIITETEHITDDFAENPQKETEYVAEETESNLEYVGCYRITAYMWTGNRMANGVYPELGYVATGNEFAFGTRLYIEGFGYYTVGDRGVPNGWIDIYMGTYEACCQVGSQYRDVYIVR